MPVDYFLRGPSESEHFRSGQRDVNPIAVNPISAAFAALAAVLCKAAGNFMPFAPELLRLFTIQRLAPLRGADGSGQLLFRGDHFPIAFENQVQKRPGVVLVFI